MLLTNVINIISNSPQCRLFEYIQSAATQRIESFPKASYGFLQNAYSATYHHTLVVKHTTQPTTPYRWLLVKPIYFIVPQHTHSVTVVLHESAANITHTHYILRPFLLHIVYLLFTRARCI